MKVTKATLKNVIKERFDLFFVYKAAEKHSSASQIMVELYDLFDQIPDDIEVQKSENGNSFKTHASYRYSR
tara:strand:+ start:1349 stop:1561 length:213 start_codon:yes stop_codon:yes gene_type:complete